MTGTGLVDATVRFGDGPAVLRGLTLLAGPGEVLAVIGPSGSGKTTALRAVAGLERVAAGRVLVAGEDVTRRPVHERGIAMVSTETALAPFLDVEGNVGWAARFGGDADAGRVADRARRLRLGHLLRRRPRTLSSGETGRAGVARALVRSPTAFLLDEPLAHLDAGERVRVRRTVLDVVRAAGAPALWVSHDQGEAMAVGDRLAVLREGAVAQAGPPREVYDRPDDVFVAGFLGEPEMALLPARAVAGGYRLGPRTLPVWGPLPAGVEPGRAVLLGLRAPDVGPPGDPASITVAARVRQAEPAGPHSVVEAELALPGEADGVRIAARLPGRARPGDRVALALDVRRAHVFDAGSGRALHHPHQK